MASPSPAELELARRRERDRERQRRYRTKRRANGRDRLQAPPLRLVPVAPPAAAAPDAAHATRPIEELAAQIDAIDDGAVPPPIAPELQPAAAPPSQEAQDGARRLAALVAGLSRLALARAEQRYGLRSRLSQIAHLEATGAEGLAGLDWDQLAGLATGAIFAATERCALKYGLGLARLPFQDELVAGGAAVGSIAFLALDLSGRLDNPRPQTAARSAAVPVPPSDAPPEEDPGAYHTVEPVDDGDPLPGWLAA
jgi:hypothetical protein